MLHARTYIQEAIRPRFSVGGVSLASTVLGME
jgi:hypothetical protein